MIWFACRQCGKSHSRPDNSAGSMIFCDCGQSLTVPWESTIAEPDVVLPVEPAPPPTSWGAPPATPRGTPPTSRGAPPALPPLPAAPAWEDGGFPRMVPVPVGEERVPVPRRPRYDTPGGRPSPARRPVITPRDRNFCFNHQDLPIERTCESCTERFCGHCLVTFQGKVMCGPCKNALLKAMDEPPRTSVLAIFSAIIGVTLSVTGFCLLPLGATADILPLVVFALLLQLGNAGMAALALYFTERTSLLRGRSLAVTGLVASGVGMLLTVAATFYGYFQWV